MKKIVFATAFKIFILLFAAYFLYLLTVIASDLKIVAENSVNGRFLPHDRYVIDSRTGDAYLITKFESFEDKNK